MLNLMGRNLAPGLVSTVILVGFAVLTGKGVGWGMVKESQANAGLAGLARWDDDGEAFFDVCTHRRFDGLPIQGLFFFSLVFVWLECWIKRGAGFNFYSISIPLIVCHDSSCTTIPCVK